MLGSLAGVPATCFALDPFLSHLLMTGVRDGELLLVEETSRHIAARRVVRLPRRHA